MTEAKQTPLPDLLDRVPDDIVLGIPGDEPVFPSYTNIPIGKLARHAAAELRRLHAQRDALLKALKGITPPMPPADAPCHVGLVPQEKCAHCGRIARARAAIKQAEENT